MTTYLATAASKLQQLAYDPGIKPDEGGLPGLDVLKTTVGSINLFAIVAVVGALCVSGIVWAWGHHTGSHGSEQKGKQGALVAAGCALLLGAANGIVSFFSTVGANVH